MNRLASLLFALLLVSCSPASSTAQTEPVTVHSTAAAGPWLTELFACANDLSIVLTVTPDDPDIFLRVGEPDVLVSPVYQVDEEELLIVTHRESPVQNLSLAEAQALFTGNGDPSVQVWVYASGEDVQGLFEQFVMEGRSVTSLAKMAVDPQQMSDVLNAESNAVGILPRHWKAGNVREVFSAGMVPVLAITKEEPQGAVLDLLTCLHNY